MPECAKVHLQQSRILFFFGEGPLDSPLSGRGKEKGGKRMKRREKGKMGRGLGREKGKGKGQGKESKGRMRR